ncbi:MAG: rod shape-determining protein MreD [Thermodesulfovibrionales bacterium]|nr:rod shape-determining protein MreD [Thermodesulfovibrionales bacterium]
MKYIVVPIILFFLFVLQGSFSFHQITPNLTVLLACYAGIKGREMKGILYGALVGIVEDSLSGAFLGPHLLSKSLVGYLSSLLYSRFFIWTPYLGILSVALLTFLDGSLVFLMRGIFDKMPAGAGTASVVILVQSLINAPAGIFLKPKDLHQNI